MGSESRVIGKAGHTQGSKLMTSEQRNSVKLGEIKYLGQSNAEETVGLNKPWNMSELYMF